MKILVFSLILTSLLFASVAWAQGNMVDVVYLKDGSVIRGVIVENTLNVSVKVKTADGNIFVFTYDEIEKLGREQAKSYSSQDLSGKSRKSAGAAWGLSFLIPGLGQFYNGDTTKGIIMGGLYFTGIIVALTAGYDTYSYGGYYDDYDGYYYSGWEYEETNDWYAVGLGVAAATWLWSMIDAPISANRINREIDNANQFGHLLEFDRGETVVGIDFGMNREGRFGASVGVHF